MKKFKYKIFNGFDHFNGINLYQVLGTDNEFNGEWHTSQEEAKKELNELLKV